MGHGSGVPVDVSVFQCARGTKLQPCVQNKLGTNRLQCRCVCDDYLTDDGYLELSHGSICYLMSLWLMSFMAMNHFFVVMIQTPYGKECDPGHITGVKYHISSLSILC